MGKSKIIKKQKVLVLTMAKEKKEFKYTIYIVDSLDAEIGYDNLAETGRADSWNKLLSYLSNYKVKL